MGERIAGLGWDEGWGFRGVGCVSEQGQEEGTGQGWGDAWSHGGLRDW